MGYNFVLLLQCWENCELLQSNYQVWGAVCDESDICVSNQTINHLVLNTYCRQ